MVIVECSSNGRFYLPEIRSRGLIPLVIYPHLPNSAYTAMRAHTRDLLDDDILVIDAPEDMDALLNMLKPYPIACVVAGSEYGVAMADELSHRLGLPGNPPETSGIRLEKSAMQEALRQAGIRHIRSRTVKSTEEAEAFWQELGVRKVVVKPLASAGTMGVHFVTTRQELSRHMNSLLASRDLFGRSVREVLIQEYIDGTEYIVNTVSCGGVHRVTDIWVYNKIAIGSEGNAYDYARLVTRLEPGQRALIEYAYQALDALGYQYGPSHGEYMMDENGPVLIEAGARPMGGGFSMDLLDACLGHHITDCALDAYLNPARFEQARQTLYRPAMEMMIKYFIAPSEQQVHTLPALSILKHFRSFRRANMTDVIESGMLKKTVDLISAPAFLQLCHPDAEILMQDYHDIRRIEQQYFKLFFSEAVGVKTPLDLERALRAYRSLPEGECFILLDDAQECSELRAHGATAITVEELHHMPGNRAGGVFALSSMLGLEECLDMIPRFAEKLCAGGVMKVLDRSFQGFPYGSAGYELMMRLTGLEIPLPLHGEEHILIGLRGEAQAMQPGEGMQADGLAPVKDSQPLPERLASQEGIEICERLGIQPGAKVFDCPCGDARISYQLALCGADVTGMDINPRLVEKARERFHQLGLRGRFSVGDLRHASYPGGCDLLLSYSNRFSEDENRPHMQAMADCLRPGGMLLLGGLNPARASKQTRRMSIPHPSERDAEATYASAHICVADEYRRLLEGAGLVLEQVFAEHFQPFTADSERMILIARKPENHG